MLVGVHVVLVGCLVCVLGTVSTIANSAETVTDLRVFFVKSCARAFAHVSDLELDDNMRLTLLNWRSQIVVNTSARPAPNTGYGFT